MRWQAAASAGKYGNEPWWKRDKPARRRLRGHERKNRRSEERSVERYRGGLWIGTWEGRLVRRAIAAASP